MRQADAARAAARELQQLSYTQRSMLLNGLADAIEAEAAAIQEANALDIAAAARNSMSEAMAARLKFPEKKIAAVADGMRSLARQQVRSSLLVVSAAARIGNEWISFHPGFSSGRRIHLAALFATWSCHQVWCCARRQFQSACS